MAFGKWATVGALHELEDGELILILDSQNNRMILEEYALGELRSTPKSAFYKVSALKIMPPDESGALRVMTCLSDPDFAEEITEE